MAVESDIGYYQSLSWCQAGTRLGTMLLVGWWCHQTTPCPQKRDSVFETHITTSNLGQFTKSGTVLKSARSQLSKTVPDFEI